MSVPISFASTAPRFKLPLLFSGQAQKEVFVNEAFGLTDALLHCAIEGISTTPPTTPIDGTNWLVGTGGTGAWAGMDGTIACLQSGNWIFVTPRDGVNVLNRATGQTIHFAGSWQTPAFVASPTGGTTIDTQARTAIVGLITALQTAGILPKS